MSISKRAKYLVENQSPLVFYHVRAIQTEGCLNFGLAENKLMDIELSKLLNSKMSLDAKHFHYNYVHGMPELHQAASIFFKKHIGLDTKEENFIVQSGSSAICENLAFVICDEGEGVLVPTPYYTGFSHDFEKRFKAKLVGFPLNPDNNFSLDEEAMEVAIKKSNIKIKAFLLTNPNNPTGRCYTKSELKIIVSFCKKHHLHLITDDVYAKSVHKGNQYLNVFDYAGDWRENTHYIYSMAKDFCLGGFKTGFLYTENKEVFSAMRDASYFCTVSTAGQEFVSRLFLNESIHLFFENSSSKIMRAYDLLKNNLNWDIPQIEAGIFFFIDFRKLLKYQTLEAEIELFESFWEKTKINITPGQFFGMTEPGFFRVCFARPDDEIKEFCKRVNDFLESYNVS